MAHQMMRREMNIGDVFHTSLMNSYNKTFFFIYGKRQASSRYEYKVISLFSYRTRLNSNQVSYPATSLFGQLHHRNEIHFLPNILENLLKTTNIDALRRYNINLKDLVHSDSYNGILFEPNPLDTYPDQIHQWAPYFLNPTKVGSFKNITPVIHLD